MTSSSPVRGEPHRRFSVFTHLAGAGLALYFGWICIQYVELNRLVRTTALSESQRPDSGLRPWTGPSKPNTTIRTPWPSYPGAKHREVSQSDVNDFPLIRERFEVSASGERIIGFYRRRLAQRGWRDQTDERFNIQPDVMARKQGGAMLQEPSFLRQYLEIKSSKLVMNRGDESILITLAPGTKRWKQDVHLKYIGSSSLDDVALSIGSRMASSNRGGNPTPILSSQEQLGDGAYDSQIFLSRKSPPQFFRHMKNRLQAKGWVANQDLPDFIAGTAKSHEQFAFFQRDSSMAILFVQPSQAGGRIRSQAMLTLAQYPGDR